MFVMLCLKYCSKPPACVLSFLQKMLQRAGEGRFNALRCAACLLQSECCCLFSMMGGCLAGKRNAAGQSV